MWSLGFTFNIFSYDQTAGELNGASGRKSPRLARCLLVPFYYYYQTYLFPDRYFRIKSDLNDDV